MLTNIRESKGRLIKEAEISTYPERYYLNTPGQGTTLTYLEDPYYRLQKSSGMIGSNGTVDWESDLRGMTRRLEKGDAQDYKDPKYERKPTMASFQTNSQMLSEDSRMSCPAWTFRELEQDRWEKPFLNPLDKAFMPFETEQLIRRKEVES